jgi:hypothetical protein
MAKHENFAILTNGLFWHTPIKVDNLDRISSAESLKHSFEKMMTGNAASRNK